MSGLQWKELLHDSDTTGQFRWKGRYAIESKMPFLLRKTSVRESLESDQPQAWGGSTRTFPYSAPDETNAAWQASKSKGYSDLFFLQKSARGLRRCKVKEPVGAAPNSRAGDRDENGKRGAIARIGPMRRQMTKIYVRIGFQVALSEVVEFRSDHNVCEGLANQHEISKARRITD